MEMGEFQRSSTFPAPVIPTFFGTVNTFRGCFSHYERDRGQVIAGSVFMFNPQEAEIKRWKDDLLWSLTYQLGNFQIYREIEEPQTRHPEIMIKADGLVKKIKYKSIHHQHCP
ncbi:hypothetical protein C8R44DRAFT_877768 [Mycena epipterygia]|nr:hypothetical protein C8R44DRAFT_877768 [Mycena epipterygia]